MNQSESNAISLLRSLAMFSIVICHFLQAMNNRYCWIFNIGVQIFLAISGYLYGGKIIKNWFSWFKKRFIKLYIPYSIFLIFCIPFYYLFAPEVINIKSIFIYLLDLQGAVAAANIKGLSHLWFMTVIALCYLITPVLQIVSKCRVVIPLFLFVSLLIFFVFKILIAPFSWFFVYILGYLYATERGYRKFFISVFVSALFVWSAVSISWDDILNYKNILNQIFHAFSGLMIIICTISIFKRLKLELNGKILNFTDGHSFEVYLIHHIFILGPFSLMQFTRFELVNILMVITLTLILSILLKRMSNYIVGLIENIK